jgi:hypothetical protein
MDGPPTQQPPYGRHPMLDDALDLVEAARADGVTLRLVGGLAVLAQCDDPALCRRPYRDLDAVGLRRQTGRLLVTFERLGYEENRHVRLASAGSALQVQRPCRHVTPSGPAHDDDRVDVYLDAFRQHHELLLAGRLGVEPFTIPVADVLLAKLLRTWPSQADVSDVLGLLAGARVGDPERPGVLSLCRVGRACARDWGLWRDVTFNLALLRERAPAARLGRAHGEQVLRALDALEAAVADARKSLRWRLRGVVGERLPWYDAVDEGDGARIGALERPSQAA